MLNIARQANNPSLLAEVLNHQGNLLTAEYDYEAALEAYTEARTHVTQDDALYSKILINQAQTIFLVDVENAYQKHAFKASIAALKQALPAAQSGPPRYTQVFGLIALGQLAQQIRAKLPEQSAQLLAIAYQALDAARNVANRLGNATAKAHVYGHLGQLYQQAKRYDDALSLTRQAVFFAQQTRQPPLLYFWQWQLGRIQNARGDKHGAIAAYQQAVTNLKSIRAQVATTGYINLTESFREKIAPVYFELADLLLQQANATQDASRRDKLLRQARKAIESFKEAELQDYFQSECVDLQTQCTDLAQIIDAQTAVLYPIPLPDRLELLLQRRDGLVQATVPIREEVLRDKIASFLSPLRRPPYLIEESDKSQSDEQSPETFVCTPTEMPPPKIDKQAQTFLGHAQTLYSWLIEPLAAQLHNIKTLVIVPDGALRTMPFSALHNGQQFLIQKYALAITPGLCLLSQPIPRPGKSTILLGGLSEAVQGFSSLPCAEYELNTLKKLFNKTPKPLLNKQFTIDNVHQELNQGAYSILHIASHGQFNADLENTFILTYDDKLSMDRLEQLINMTTIQDKPVELLTLSACETAVGDDRAALGLAGIALKAGVESTLASLWKVDDVATQALVVEFYRQLQNRAISKAQALQNAQTMMLTDDLYRGYRHPYFWSAFLLIGNWL